MKKLCALLIIPLVVLIFTSCDAGRVTSETIFTSMEGAGTKTIIVHVLKDDAEIPEYPGSTVGNNSPYFPEGMEAAQALLQANIAEGFTVNMEEQDDRHIFTISYSFDNIDDYNAKTKMLIGEDVWDENSIADSTITAAEAEGGYDVTFTEDPQVLVYSVRWAALTFLNDETGVYEKDAVEDVTVDEDTIMQTYKTQVTIGDAEQVFEPEETISLTGFIASEEEPEETEEPEDTETNPETGDTSYLYYIIPLTALLLLALFVIRRKREN